MKRVKTYYSLLSLVTCIAPALVIVPAGSATSGTLVIKRTLS